jgi:heme exporter protein B
MMRPFVELVRKDLALQWRNRDALVLVVLFALMVVLVFAFAYGPFFTPLALDADERRRELAKLASAVFWVAMLFSGVIALSRGAELDRVHGALRAIRLSGVAPEALYFSKVVSTVVLLGFVEAVLAPLTLVFLQVNSFTTGDGVRLAGIAALGTLGFSAIGAFLATMTASVRGRESFLSIMLLPVLVPLLIAATKCSVPVFASEALTEPMWLGLLAAYPFVSLAICGLLFEFVLEE